MNKHMTLPNGVTIPATGFGVFQIPADQTANAVVEAINAGYRHLDTAQSYFNEAEVGEGIRRSGLDRSELFVTTKVWIDNYGEGRTLASVRDSLAKLGLDYIDLMLLHQPFSDIYGAWRDLEKAYDDGLIRAIGVSNFNPARLHDLGSFTDVYPMVNQIEINPFHQQTERVAELHRHGVVVEAWAPFGEGRSGLFTHPVLSDIGKAYGKSAAQVVLRWLLQRNIVPLAKSVRRERMEQNIAIDDFELSREDMERIAALDEGTSLFFDHDTIDTVDLMKNLVEQRRNR